MTKGCFLTITDKNTTGLTGKGGESSEADFERTEDAHWQRFEASDYTKDSPNARGSRGQGKFILLCSSDEYKMFYDTLRADEVYRFGGTKATKMGCPIFPKTGIWEYETAESQLASHCGLPPLSDIGTRFIIFSPKEEVLKAFRNGDFAEAVKETWFRAIQKNQLEVYLDIDGVAKKVELDDDFMIETNTADTKSWILGKDFNDNQIKAGGEKYKIKRLELFYRPDKKLLEAWQGCALIHRDMKICSLEGELRDDKALDITGFIEFDKKLDDELYKDENQMPSHNQLLFTRTIPKAIKAYVNTQFQDFGKSKLGIGQDSRAKKQQEDKETEEYVFDKLEKYGVFELSGAKGGKRRKSKQNPDPPSHKKIGIRFRKFTFSDPNKEPRVDWGDSVSFYLTCFNKTDTDFEGSVSLRIHYHGTKIETLEKKLEVLIPLDNHNHPVKLENHNYLVKDGMVTVAISKERFVQKGKYSIKAQLNDVDGEKVDFDRKTIWVEEDKPENSNRPFTLRGQMLEGRDAWEIEGVLGEESATLFYNTTHPEYKNVAGEKDERNEYILKISMEAIVSFTLKQAFEKDEDDDIYKPLDTQKILEGLDSKEPAQIYQAILSHISEFRWKMFEEGNG